MRLVDTIHAERLVTLTRERFDPKLSDDELRVIHHSCRYEDPPDWVAPSQEVKGKVEIGKPHCTVAPCGRPLANWQGSEVRPALVRWLLTDPDATAMLEPRGFRVWNARFTEPLDLRHCRIPVRLEFRYCLFTEAIILTSTEILGFYLKETSLLKGIEAPGLTVRGRFFLREVAVGGGIDLARARIDAEISMARTHLTRTSDAMTLENARIEKDVLLSPAFCSCGRLNFDSIHVGGSVLMKDAEVKGIRMIGAVVEGQLNLNGAKLTASDDTLLLEAAIIRGSVMLRDKFVCCGRASLRGAEIGGTLDCEEATFSTTGDALALEGARVRVAIFLRNNFSSAGLINMHGVDIGNELDCSGAKLTNSGKALSLEAARIGGHVLLNNDFECFGSVFLSAVKIGGQLSCDRSFIRTLIAQNAEVGGDFLWREIRQASRATLDLVGAKVRFFRDDRASWPSPGNLQLAGLLMEDLLLSDPPSSLEPSQVKTVGQRPLTAKDRIAWLNRQAESQIAEPQPWFQLATLLEGKGQKRDAKRVIFELRKHQAEAAWKTRTFKLIGQRWALAFARLEEQPLRILITVALCVALGTALFWPAQSYFSPTSEAANRTSNGRAGDLPMAYPKFQPIVYALENVLPAVKLGQDDHWAPDARHSSSALYWNLMFMRWFLILAGYVQGGILAVALSARFRS